MAQYSHKRRLELLGSAGTALALAIAGSTIGAPIAGAATVDSVSASATGDKTVVSQINNSADVTAQIDASNGGVQTDATSGGSTTNAATGNDVVASATGNVFNNQIDLTTVEASANTGGGAALGLSTNEAGANVTASATANTVFVDLVDFSTGSATNDGNTITATATANNSSTLLTGAIGNDFASTTTGEAETSRTVLDLAASEATGSLIAATRQTSLDPANTATVAGNAIVTSIESTADNIVTASPSVSGNAIAATLKGNASQSTINIAGDDSPQYEGSAVVSNFQESVGAGTSGALNTGSSIGGSVYADGISVNTLTGTLAVENNTISSSAGNNAALGNGATQAGNEVLLNGALSLDGSTASASFGVSRATSDYSAATTGDLAVQNVQTSAGDDTDERLVNTAQTIGGEVSGRAEALANGSVAVSGNAITATAKSNAASSRIANGDNAAAFSGTAAIGNVQENRMVDIAATSVGGTIGSTVEDGFNASSVASTGNTVSASAYGNQASQSASLEATSLGIGAVEANASTNPANGSVTSAGAIMVGNLQANVDTAVTANQSSAISAEWLAASDSAMTGSSLTASGNTQEAVAVGSSAANSAQLEGTTVGSGTGVVNYQTADAASSVEATSTGQVGAFAGDSITASEMTVSNNLQRSIAYGASSGNTLAITGNSLAVPLADPTDVSSSATFASGSPEALSPEVRSANILLNRQSQAGDVSASAVSQTAFENRVEGDVTQGTLENDGNKFVAAAYGTDASNAAAISANTIDTDGAGYASVAAVNNAQNLTGADVLARAAGENVVLTDVFGDAAETSVSTSQNSVQALAFGNLSTGNSLRVDGTTIDTSVDGTPLRGSAGFDTVSGTATVDASFAAQNAQHSSGTVTASLLTSDIDPTSAQIRTRIGESITGGSVVSDDNLSTAGATANRATTSVTLEANQLATTAGVHNGQVNDANLAALIGIAGTDGSPGDPGTPPTPVAASGGSDQGTMSPSGNILTITGAPVTVTFSDYTFTADEAAYLNGLAGISGATTGGNSLTFAVGTIDTSVFNNFVPNSGDDGFGSGDETFTVTGFTIPGTPATPATLATPNQGGVTVAIGDDVTGSAVSVSGNTTSGSVLGNSATNSVVASATEISGGSGLASSTATGSSATADLALANTQSDTADTEASTVYGTFAIDATGGDIAGSSLTVSNNVQRSDAGSNLATNVIEASATNLSAGSALSSSQASAAAVSALSDLDVFAPGASTQSTTKMNGNANTARAVVNEASNSVDIAAANVAPVSAANLVDVPVQGAMNADHALVSSQTASGSASSVASSEIFNGDAAQLATNGLQSGSIEVMGNTTTAQSVANLASNAMTVEGSANQGASAGIGNVQNSSAIVTANATSTAGIVLAGDDTVIPGTAAANDASIRIGNNTTTAVARGNSASNVLNMDAGATYGTAGAGAPGVEFAGGGTVDVFAATGGVLNQQSNVGAVSAVSTGVSYQIALNAPDGNPTVTGSAASVSGNAVNAQAYGNNAANRIVMTALNSGTPSAAIGNYQSNAAAVTATVTTVGYGIAASSGVIGGSTFATTGNQVAATAVGNSAVSVIAAGN